MILGPLGRANALADSARVRLAIGTVLSAAFLLGTAGVAAAQTPPIKLVLAPVGQPGTFFDLTMTPGDHRTLAVDLGNDGTAALAVRTYAADVYTIVDGGFGARLHDAPATGATRWVAYPPAVLTVGVGDRLRRTFTVTVPPATTPGEYIASVVVENAQPIAGQGSVALDQVIRQAVAIVVTVPGRRSPALSIGEASHQVVAGNSVVAVAVENGGNVRLAPTAAFALFDAAGTEVSHATLPIGTFYAGTSTSIEVPLDSLLLPGTYSVHLTLADASQDVRATAEVPLVIVAPPADGAPQGVVAGLANVAQGGGSTGPGGSLPIAIGAGLLAAALVGLVWLRLRSKRRLAPDRG